MASKKACNIAGTATKNTGSRCGAMLTQPWMVLFGSTSLEIPANVIEEDTGTLFIDWINTHIHAVGAQKVFPFGGNKQPFDDTPVNTTNPTIHTSAITGAIKQMLAGYVNLTLTTLEGGLCLAKSLLTIGKSSLGVILFDKSGGYLPKKNSNGTYGFFNSTNSPGALTLQIKDVPYTNSVNISLNPETIVQLGEYYVDDTGAVIDVFGLTDVEVDSRAAATATTETVGGTFECGGGDIYDQYGSALAVAGAWKITKVSDGTTVAITGVTTSPTLKAYVLTHASLGTGVAVKIDLVGSDALYAINVTGIESVIPVTITTP